MEVNETNPLEISPSDNHYLNEDIGKLAYWLESIGILSTEDIYEYNASISQTGTITRKSSNAAAEKELLYLRLKDGVALCKLLQYIRPDSLSKFNLTVAGSLAAVDNLRSFLSGCENDLNIDQRLIFDAAVQNKQNFDRILLIIVFIAKIASSEGKKPTLEELKVSKVKRETLDEHILKQALKSKQMIAIYEYEATKHDELSFKEGEIINVINLLEGGWWEGTKVNGEMGWFPSNYVRLLTEEEVRQSKISLQEVSPTSEPGQMPDQLVFRTIFLQENLHNEQQFLNSIQSFYDIIVLELSSVENQRWLPDSDHSIIFGRLKEVIELQRSIFHELDICIRKKYKEQMPGMVFKTLTEPITRVFSEYCVQYSQAVTLMGKYRDIPDFKTSLQNAYNKPAAVKAKIYYSYPPSLNLMTWLIKPWQRVTKYPVFLRELLQYTPTTHPDHLHVQEAFAQMNSAIDIINGRKRTAENREIMAEVGVQIEGWEGAPLNSFGDLIMEGNLKIKKKDCNCFLLDRVFIVLQKLEGKKTNGLKYKLFDRFPVSKPFMQVSDVEGVSEFSFQINFNWEDHKTRLVLSASSFDSKQSWMKSITKTLNDNGYVYTPDLMSVAHSKPGFSEGIVKYITEFIAHDPKPKSSAEALTAPSTTLNIHSALPTEKDKSNDSGLDQKTTPNTSGITRAKSLRNAFTLKGSSSELKQVQTPAVAPVSTEKVQELIQKVSQENAESTVKRSKSLRNVFFRKNTNSEISKPENPVLVNSDSKKSYEELILSATSVSKADPSLKRSKTSITSKPINSFKKKTSFAENKVEEPPVPKIPNEFLGISSNDANSPYQKEIIEKLSSPVFETHLPRPKLSNTPSAVEQPVSFSLEKEITEIESLLIDVKSPTSNSLIQKASLSESEKSKQTLLNDKTKIVIQNKNENDPKNEMSVESQISILSGLLAEMSVKKARLSSANQTPNMTPVQSKFSIEIPTKKISSPPSPENNSRQNHIDSLISKRDISKSLKNSDIDVTSLSAGNHSQSSKVISKTNMIKYQLLTSEIRSMHSDFPKNLDLGSDMSVSELQDLSIWLLKRQITSDQKIEELKKEISLLKHKNAQ